MCGGYCTTSSCHGLLERLCLWVERRLVTCSSRILRGRGFWRGCQRVGRLNDGFSLRFNGSFGRTLACGWGCSYSRFGCTRWGRCQRLSSSCSKLFDLYFFQFQRCLCSFLQFFEFLSTFHELGLNRLQLGNFLVLCLNLTLHGSELFFGLFQFFGHFWGSSARGALASDGLCCRSVF